jgi:hypothetical protein
VVPEAAAAIGSVLENADEADAVQRLVDTLEALFSQEGITAPDVRYSHQPCGPMSLTRQDRRSMRSVSRTAIQYFRASTASHLDSRRSD